MNIKNTFILTTIHTFIKILSGVILNKIIAVYLGPSGLATIGQFQNFASIVSSLSNGSIQTGLLTQTAQFVNHAEERKKVWFNALFLNILFSIFTSIIVIIFSEWLSQQILFSKEYNMLFIVFGTSIIFYTLNLFFLSIVNGLGNIKLYTIINIFISIFSLMLVALLTIVFNLEGSIIGLILTQSLVFFISYFMIYRYYQNSFFNVDISMLDINMIKVLLSYGIVSFSSGLIVSLTYILIRIIIVTDASWEEAGLWEGALKIGIYFNLLFSLPLSIYLLPKFSESKDINVIINLLKQAIIFILPLMFVSATIFLLFKEFFIHLLFDNTFIKIKDFIIFIIFAEVFRIIINLFINLLMAKRKLFINIIFELISYCLLLISAYFIFDIYGLYGIGIAYFIIFATMFAVYFIYLKKTILTLS